MKKILLTLIAVISVTFYVVDSMAENHAIETKNAKNSNVNQNDGTFGVGSRWHDRSDKNHTIRWHNRNDNNHNTGRHNNGHQEYKADRHHGGSHSMGWHG